VRGGTTRDRQAGDRRSPGTEEVCDDDVDDDNDRVMRVQVHVGRFRETGAVSLGVKLIYYALAYNEYFASSR
jgi:hypothetical protein